MAIRYLAVLAAAATLGVYLACPPSVRPISPEARLAAETWLARTCSVEGDQELEATLLRHKAELEPFFLEALERGPEPGLVRDVEAVANERYDRQQELFASGERFGLSAEDLRMARAGNREQYLGRERTALVNRYKSQAVAALGLLGGERGRRRLEALASDARSPLESSARAALGRQKSGKR